MTANFTSSLPPRTPKMATADSAGAAAKPPSLWCACLKWVDAPLLLGMAMQFTATYNFTDSSIAVDLLERDHMTAPGWVDGALYGSIFGGCIVGQARDRARASPGDERAARRESAARREGRGA